MKGQYKAGSKVLARCSLATNSTYEELTDRSSCSMLVKVESGYSDSCFKVPARTFVGTCVTTGSTFSSWLELRLRRGCRRSAAEAAHQ
jgi:hypothetical protein